MRVFATFTCVSAFLCAAAELRVEPSAMYGHVAVVKGGKSRFEIALCEGVRIISWIVDGNEVGFVGRIWGGDMYDRYTVDGAGGDTRFAPPETVKVLRTPSVVALRARFALAKGVLLERTLAVTDDALFLETSFVGKGRFWHAFSPHLKRKGADGPGEIRFLADGGAKVLPLDRQALAEVRLPATIAICGLAESALVFQALAPVTFSLNVWGTNIRLDMGAVYKGEPLRVCWRTVPEKECATALSADPPAFPVLRGVWEVVPSTVPPSPRPPVADIARTVGSLGVCNSNPVYMAPLAAAGIRWTRVGSFSWIACEIEEGVRDYSRADAAVAAARAAGLSVIGEMSGNPGWATRDGNLRSPPKDWEAWEKHVEQVVLRYRGRVRVWEVWNEPDLASFWTGTAADYVDLLKHAYIAAKRADPDCLVMSAGLDGSGEAYLAKILDMGAGSFCDLVGAHPYAGSAKMADRRMAIMRRILAFHKVEKPLWITEVGWQSGGWKSGPGVVADEEVKARRLSDAYPLLQERADVVCWYVGVEPGRMYGLLQPTGSAGFTLNPAWFAMRDLAISRDLDISVECPEKAVAQAGEPMLLVARVRCAQPVQAQWCGIEPEWGRVESVGVSPGQPAEIALRFLVPEYARSGQRHLLLLVQDRQGSPIASHAVELSVENEGRVCDFSLGGGWIRKIEADGQEVGKWRPAHQLCPVPGEGFLQPLRPKNLGNFDDTLKLTVGGTAAKWLDDMPATVSVPAGKRGWVSLRVRVPAEAVPGTYTLEVRASSKAFPAVVREWRGVYSIVAPSGGK